jgi:hypothetical protein
VQETLILNRYRRLDKIGEGASGVVDICWDTRIKRRVAIKHLPINEQSGTDAIPGLAEARTAALLSHPHIVSVLDFETSGNEALLIMEAIEGPTLSELIDETPAASFDLDIVASIADAVGQALDFAHENQVLHLDIKPDNILIAPNGTTKVSDFGVSELADAQGFGEASGGTIGYMPIEQMSGLDLDQRCDEFSLAVVVYEMLTGISPFVAPTMEASKRLIHRFELTAPSALRDDVAPEIDEVVLTAMSPNREERYETIYDFMHELMPLLGDAQRGTRKLKQLLTGAEADDEDLPERTADGRDLWERLSGRPATIAGRLASFALCGLVSALSLAAWPGLDSQYLVLISLIPAAIALASPLFGGLVSLVMSAACIAFGDPRSPALGLLVALGACVWGIGERKGGACDVNCALGPLPLSVVGLAPLGPFLTGFFLPVRRALIASGFSAFLFIVFSFLTGSPRLFTLHPGLVADVNLSSFLHSLASFSLWVRVAAWIVSAVLMSALCSRATRVSSILGASLCAAALIGGDVLANWCSTYAWTAPSSSWTAFVVLAFLLMIVIGALGAPRRIKE